MNIYKRRGWKGERNEGETRKRKKGKVKQSDS